MPLALIHYSEIGLKGKNQKNFIERLFDNIRQSSLHCGVGVEKITKDNKRILARLNGDNLQIEECLKNVLGIKYFAIVEELGESLDDILQWADKELDKLKDRGVTQVSFKTKRLDKKFQLNSVGVNTKMGELASQKGIKVNYKNLENVLSLEIDTTDTLAYNKKIEAYGGLPVGTSGRVLCLLSGGIDSPVAAWNMMRRGCRVDFLHVHNFTQNKTAAQSKIKQTVEILNKYQFKSKLVLAPYLYYQSLAISGRLVRYDVIIFKHFLLALADELVTKNKYDAIVTGDNLAQVASQTMPNLQCASDGINNLVFRPLLTYDKQEIVNLARKIGTYDISIEQYPDCCSINAKSPKTNAKKDKFKYIKEEIDIGKLVTQTVNDIEIIDVN